jgi:hypothetical protein
MCSLPGDLDSVKFSLFLMGVMVLSQQHLRLLSARSCFRVRFQHVPWPDDDFLDDPPLHLHVHLRNQLVADGAPSYNDDADRGVLVDLDLQHHLHLRDQLVSDGAPSDNDDAAVVAAAAAGAQREDPNQRVRRRSTTRWAAITTSRAHHIAQNELFLKTEASLTDRACRFMGNRHFLLVLFEQHFQLFFFRNHIPHLVIHFFSQGHNGHLVLMGGIVVRDRRMY